MANAKLINRVDTAANWAAANPTLDAGEFGYTSDTHILKIGAGSWNDLEGVKLVLDEVKLGSVVLVPKYICYPASLCFFADYNVDGVFDATYGKGALTGTAYNSPIALDGRLDCTGLTYQRVDYAGVGNANTAIQQGCVRFNVTPNFNGIPPTFLGFFHIDRGEVNNKNVIRIAWADDDGSLFLAICDKDGNSLFDYNLGQWLPNALQTYEFEINWDLDSPAIRVFIDGAQIGNTIEIAGTRDSNINRVSVGGYNYETSFYIDKFKIFNQVIHTSNYTPGEDDNIIILPSDFSKYVACIGGEVSNESSPFYGFPIPDLTSLTSTILGAWKILE